jgi:hypothetical protein
MLDQQVFFYINFKTLFLQSMKWREKWGASNIDSWDPPAVLKKFGPFGTTGFDKDGSAIIFIPFAGIDIWGLLHSASKHDIIKFTFKRIEGAMML